MPSDDLVINVRQIAGYPPVSSIPPASWLVMQTGGLGGPYASISPANLVGTALAAGGDMTVMGTLTAQAFTGGSATFSNAFANLLSAQKACINDLQMLNGSIGGQPIATQGFVLGSTVTSFNGRMGAVRLWIDDIKCAGGAPIYSPMFLGCPRAGTPPPTSNSSRLATTAFVQSAVGALVLDYAPINSPAFTGIPTAPTPALTSADGTLATTAFVHQAVAASTTGVSSFNTRTGAVVLTTADVTGAGGAPLASPTFTGVPAGPTAALGTDTTQLATTAFVLAAIATSTTGVSSFNARTGAVTLTTADITAVGGALVASTVASFNGRTGIVTLAANDISAASGALLASPAFVGAPTAPTPLAGDNSTHIATTAFVMAAPFAPLASPAFTGVPTGPTAALNTNTTQLATTAFVLNEIAGSTAGVASFNSRTGIVTLAANDISAASGALLASPAFTGTPSAPTATAGTSTTQLATTAFVMAAIGVSAANYLPLTGGTISGGVGLNIAGTNGLNITATNGLSVSQSATITGNVNCNNLIASNSVQGLSGSFGGNGLSCTGNVGLNGNFINLGNVVNLVQANARVNVENPNGLAMQVMSSLNGASANAIFVRNDRTDGNAILFYFGQSTLVGRITQNGSTTQYLTTSDYRIKTVYGPALDVGELIDAVPVYDAEFKQQGALARAFPAVARNILRYPMFLAHELQAACPWAVSGEKDAENEDGSISPQGVDASKVVAVLWAEVQNLRRRLTALELAA